MCYFPFVDKLILTRPRTHDSYEYTLTLVPHPPPRKNFSFFPFPNIPCASYPSIDLLHDSHLSQLPSLVVVVVRKLLQLGLMVDDFNLKLAAFENYQDMSLSVASCWCY